LEGIKEGIEQGKLEGIIEVANSLLDILDDEMIAEKCKLSLEQVRHIRKNRKQ